MDTLTIDTGVRRVLVNNDPTRVIEFNPNDILFAQKYYRCMRAFQEREAAYKARAAQLQADNTLGEDGVPLNAGERIDLLKELCDFTREQIDLVFGAGTSQTAFGDSYAVTAFSQFFNGMRKYITPARNAHIEKYINPVQTKRKAHRAR